MKKINYSRFINSVSAARKQSPIRATTAIALSNPDVLSLGAGWPNPSLFPFQSAQLTISDGLQISFEANEMKEALQYTNSQGTKKLVFWVKKMQQSFHSPPIMKENEDNNNFDVCVTNGSQDALSKAFSMLGNSGDYILMDNPCYTGTLAMLRPYGYNLVPIETDKFGMRSDSLLKFMQQWSTSDADNPQSDIPKYIYTIPTCGNPTGASASLERKKEIYELFGGIGASLLAVYVSTPREGSVLIAQKYNMLIIEDDPYFFLQFGVRTPSYQSLDVDGRVIRCDSMSKIMSSGLRIGWVSGPKPLITRIILHQQTTVIHSSTFGQVMVASLLQKWGLEGFENHIKRVQDFYQLQRDAMIRCLNKRLKGLAEWNVPEGGMFVWIKLNGISDTTALIQNKALEKKILLIPGSVFEVEEGKPSSYCRAAYSFATEDVMDEALRRLAEIIREEQDNSS